jgi:heme exporter protein A
MDKKPQNNSSDESIIDVNSVSKSFGTRPVLKGINLQVGRAQGVCICGVNGAGKSTLLRIISGLLEPSQGSVKLCGMEVGSEPEKTKSQLGVISHKSMLYPDLSLSENLLFFARLYSVKESHKRVKELLEELGLASYRYDRTGILSRGMLQRLAIARAVIHRPAVLLADEPFTGLDTEACRHLISVLGKFRADGGTLIMTSHDTRLGLQCCDRVMVLEKARIVFEAMTSQIDTNLFVKDYLAYARDRD